MATTGGELAQLVKSQVLNRGTHYLVVLLPDVGSTPFGNSFGARHAGCPGNHEP